MNVFRWLYDQLPVSKQWLLVELEAQRERIGHLEAVVLKLHEDAIEGISFRHGRIFVKRIDKLNWEITTKITDDNVELIEDDELEARVTQLELKAVLR